MAQIYLPFSDLKFEHFHGLCHIDVIPAVEEFITNNPDYIYVDFIVNYSHDNNPEEFTRWPLPTPDTCMWVEVTLIYSEKKPVEE